MSIKALWQILAVLTAVVLMILFPIMNTFEREDDLVRLQMLDQLDYFVSKLKQSGSISRRDYELFSSKLNQLGIPFEITIEHYKQIYVPVYEDPLDFTSFHGKIQRAEELFSDAEIKTCLFPIETPEKGKDYTMSKGDYISVSVKSKVKSKHQKLRSMFFGGEQEAFFYAKLGGVIQNEAK